jgi:hypothetical protein
MLDWFKNKITIEEDNGMSFVRQITVAPIPKDYLC